MKNYIRRKTVDKEKLALYLKAAKGGRTMKQFAEDCGVNPSTFSRILNQKLIGASSEKLMLAIFEHADSDCGFTLDALMAANGMLPEGTVTHRSQKLIITPPRKEGNVMYEVRIYTEKKLKDVVCYRSYENALSDIVEGDPNLWELAGVDYEKMDYSRPQIISTSVNEQEYGRDFKFIYETCGVEFFLREIYPMDAKFGEAI